MLSKLMYKYAPHFDGLQHSFCLHKAYSRFLVVGINSPTLPIGKVGESVTPRRTFSNGLTGTWVFVVC